MRRALAALLVIGAGGGTAMAQTSPAVTAARSAGLIGERFDGYLGARIVIPAATRQATESVNIRRRALYAGLAARRGVSRDEVGITAGCSLLARVAVGEWYLLGDGEWRQRRPGQPAPIPDYCKVG